MPALDTQSGIPYGSVNLRRGVAATESPATASGAPSAAHELRGRYQLL